MRWNSNHIFISLVLLVAAVVRFWGFPEMDYHHDEISALLRTRFTNFTDLVTEGIRIDGHPGFVQWFLWVWTGAFGYAPWVVKLPFIFAGVASVGFIFALGNELFARRVGLLSATLLAVLQYGVTYSQWARPYAFGLLLVLAAVYFLVRFDRTSSKLDLLAYALLTALAVYTHYFAGLQVIVTSVLIATFRFRGLKLGWWVLGSILAAVLWLPHLNITLHHLHIGGIGDWLQVPDATFLLQWVAYSLHFSWLLGAILALLVVTSIGKGTSERIHWIARSILLFAWLLPFAIAYAYSHQVSAVMHNGTMFFAFPWFILLLGSFAQSFQTETVRMLSVLLMLVGIHTLFVKRQHVANNLLTEYGAPLNFAEKAEWRTNASKQQQPLKMLIDLRPDAVAFLKEHGVADFSAATLIEPLWKSGLWSHYLDTLSADRILILTTPASLPEYLATAQHVYSNFLEGQAYHTAAANLLQRTDGSEAPCAAQEPAYIPKMKEYGTSHYVEVTDSNMRSRPFYVIDAVFSGIPGEAKLVYDWESNNGRKEWRASYFKDFRQATTRQHAIVGGAFDDLPGIEVGGSLNIYVWNPRGDSLRIDCLRFRRMEGVNRTYGLFDPI